MKHLFRAQSVVLLLAFTVLGAKCPNGDFIRAEGQHLVHGYVSRPIHLRGIAFGNQVWGDNAPEIPSTHHDERDYQRVKDMGMNVVRFYINAKTLEDADVPYVYKQSGWDWLDQNVAWAKQHRIYLILNLHVPIGGYQSNGGGLALWSTPEYKQRFVAFWTAVASRYKNEPTIAGYDLLNEPVPTSFDEWQNLAQATVDAVRAVDRNHLIIIERALGVYQQPDSYNDLAAAQIFVNDPYENVMYDFHFYSPIEYTHQTTAWTGLGEGGAYPDENRYSLPVGSTLVGTGPQTAPIAGGTSEWTLLQSDRFVVADPSYAVATPVLGAINLQSATVYFDDLAINEYNSAGDFVRQVVSLEIESADGWQLYSPGGTGSCVPTTIEKYAGEASVAVTGTTGYAGYYNTNAVFIPKQGYSYTISGYVKGKDMPADAMGALTIAFLSNPSGQPLFARNKDYLENAIVQHVEFGKTHNVPMNIGEFGLYNECFKDDKGGLTWVSDMIDLMKKHDLNFTYHAYHEWSFGLYGNDDGLPDPSQANQPLIDLFVQKLLEDTP